MRIIFLIIFLFSLTELEACDGCNISSGIVNVDPVNYISLRHRNVSYKGSEIPFFRHTGDGEELTENYLSHEFAAKYFLYKKFYIQTLVSIKEVVVFSEEIDQKISGFSDPIFLIGYQNSAIFKKWKFNYNIFGGLDVGIGEYNTSIDEEYSPGSKTTDLLVGSEFIARFAKVGIISKFNYKRGYTNNFGYEFGKIINTGLHTCFFHKRGDFTIIPLVGFSLESNFIDYHNNRSVKFSLSDVFFVDSGLNIMFRERFIFGVKYKIPLYKNLPGWADLKLNAFEFELSFVLGS